MVRVPLTISEHERGQRLGHTLRDARGDRSIVDVAAQAGISPETLRKIERGRIPTPAFFTVVAVADVLGLLIDELLAAVTAQPAEVRVPAEAADRLADVGHDDRPDMATLGR